MFQQDLAESFGYPFQAHEVSSETGYILSLHRIPYGIKRKQSNGTKRPVALFQHGLVSASDMWLFQGPDINLRKFIFSFFFDRNKYNTFNSIYIQGDLGKF